VPEEERLLLRRGPAHPHSIFFSSRLPREKSDQIARHLAACDFCAAEQSHLSASSRTTGEYEPPEMPAHLVAWAEALLRGKLKDSYRG